jgi:thiosulfate/3-mercaptopyruvate sulfurtransferase
MMRSNNLATADWLHQNLNHPHLVIVDCRFELGNVSKGIEEYQKEHIVGAVHLDLERDLSGLKQKHGGRHPLPDLTLFLEKLGQCGIDGSKKVVAYDDQGGVMAARLWWMLRYLGHKEVVVLREGFSGWKEKGYPTSNEVPEKLNRTFSPTIQTKMLVEMEEVKNKLADKQTILIDSRAEERYQGIVEDIDPKAGHIPSALNEFWKESLQPDGQWKSIEEQRTRLSAYLQQKDKEIILYCGSGVTACANILAFEEVGLHPRLYLGSWSDWISYPENKIASKQ